LSGRNLAVIDRKDTAFDMALQVIRQ